jgi:hypothetical protein
MRARRILVAGAAALTTFLLAPSAWADAAIAWTRTTPTVVRVDQATPVRLVVKIKDGVADAVQFTPLTGAPVALRDDGAGGDAVAGDGEWTVELDAAPLVGGLTAADVFRRFVGFADLYIDGTRAARVNLLVQVWTPDLGAVGIASPDATARFSEHVVNVADPALFAADPGSNDSAVVQRLLQRFGDGFDFVDIVFDRATVANRFHNVVRNAVSGIGLGANDLGSAYGSAARLKGVTVFPGMTFFDAGARAHSHEIGHQWINYLAQAALSTGGPHWPISTLASGTMGFSIAGLGEGGDYPCSLSPVADGLAATPRTGVVTFKDLDLYLMGFVPASDVATHYVFKSQATALSFACEGTIPYNQFTAVTMADVLASAGPRVPAHPAAQRDFTVGVIVVSDAPLSDEAMAFYDYFARRADARVLLAVHEGLVKQVDAPFFLQTGGRATLTARLPFASRATATVVEYYRADRDHYFLTADPIEIAGLDAGVFAGWARSGYGFSAFSQPADGAGPVCRFYLPPPEDSHFFSASTAECATVAAEHPTFIEENASAFYIGLPDPLTGVCAPGETPVYRLWNRRVDTNHRYTIEPAIRAAMQAQGWLAEGYGPNAVAMCAPP